MADNPLSLLVRKLRGRAAIDAAGEAAILGVPYNLRTYEAPAYVIREGSTALDFCSLIVSGYAFRQKLTVEGKRQIVSLHMRGDLLDLQQLFLQRTDHSIQALTQLDVINIDRAALRKVVLENPTVAEAMWIEALVDGSIYRDWITNIGQRDAKTRVAHLLCEFAVRSKAIGLGDGRSCSLPMTQEQIGDAVGLTSVHVNRTLKTLQEEGIIQRNKREIAFTHWDIVRRAGDFTSSYLHLDEGNNGLGSHG